MMKKYLLSFVLFLLVLPISVLAGPDIDHQDRWQAFRSYKDFTATGIVVPTVVEIPLEPGVSSRGSFLVDPETSLGFVPYLFRQTKIRDFTLNVSATGGINAQAMIDGNQSSFTDFPLPFDRSGSTRITVYSSKSISLDHITLLLGDYVSLPTSIEIKKVDNGQEVIVLAKSPMRSETVTFPVNTANQWVIDLDYSQPLRIEEILVEAAGSSVISSESIRFLAQPNQSYRIYFNADRYVSANVSEMPNLADDRGVKKIASLPTVANPLFSPSDADGDKVIDINDNCVHEVNQDQKDVDANGRGDACDDFDRDGWINSKDNCPDQPNTGQYDRDGDKIGDECDADESRLTERYPILPWLGIGFAALVVVVLFALSFYRKPPTMVVS